MHGFDKTEGSRAEVLHGTAKHTSGGLEKKDLMKNKWGRIVSLKKHKTAKKEKRLEKAGYFAKNGSFGVVKRGTKKRRRGKSSRKRGGERPICQKDFYLLGHCPKN